MPRTSSRNAHDAARHPGQGPSEPGASRASGGGRNLPVAILAGIGLLLTAYLSYTAWAQSALAFCDATSGCDAVQSSRRASLLGLPIAYWGLVTYAILMLVAAVKGPVTRRYRLALTLAMVASLYSLYLNVASLIELQAWCVYCLASLGLITGIATLLLMRPWQVSPARRNQLALQGVVASGVLVALMQLHYSGMFVPSAGPEDPYLTDLARHLGAAGVKFYGASWCPHCQQQKALFKGSVDYLPYIECSPHGRGGPPATACVTAEINSFPTWVISGRRYSNVMTIEQLARLSGYQGSE